MVSNAKILTLSFKLILFQTEADKVYKALIIIQREGVHCSGSAGRLVGGEELEVLASLMTAGQFRQEIGGCWYLLQYLNASVEICLSCCQLLCWKLTW